MKGLWMAPMLAALVAGCGGEPTHEGSHASYKEDPRVETVGIDTKQGQRDVRELIDAEALFAKDDPREWERGKAEIESLPSQVIVPKWVREALRDAFSSDRARAKAAREHLGLAGQTGILLRRLESPRIEDWDVACEALETMGQEPAFALVTTLVKKFESPSARQWEMARAELVQMGDLAVPVLGRYMESSAGAGLKEQCGIALAYMHGPGDSELLRLARGAVEANRCIAVTSLGMSGTPAALGGLDRAVRSDPSWKVRAEAVRALGKTRLPETAATLVAALSDSDPFVRRTAAEDLGGYSCSEAALGLRSATSDRDVDVAACAGKSLDQVLRRLIAMLHAHDPSIRATAAQSLRSATGERYGDDARSWESWMRDRKE